MACIFLAFAGCSDLQYVKAGATAAEFDADRVQCEQGRELVTGYGLATQPKYVGSEMMRGQVALDDCLREKGWRLETAEEAAARKSSK